VAIARPDQFRLQPTRIERRLARHDDGPLPDTVVIAVEQPNGRWLVTSSPWSRGDGRLFWRLLAQTLILYAALLLPVLWIARRISRPLRELARAARDYAPAVPTPPLPLHGPPDVQAVIAAFNALRLRVTAMLDEKDRMLGAIGHDLRTPLAALRVRIESVEDEQDRARMADVITEMNRTLDDILSLARLGRPSEPVTDIDLAALVDAVVEDFRDLGSPVSFEESARLRMRLRPSLMRRAIRNLIENAVKFGGSADVSLDVGTTSAAIVVNDNGPGIPEAQMQDVFTPFTRLETSRNRDTGGIGLGLALARAIVHEAGGDIALSNRPEGGLSARIVLPR
jgi:signal transduction histidine kinase